MGNIINRRRVCGVEKGLLPSKYTQVEYLKSTGTQWINTGVRESDINYMELKFETVDDSSGFMFVNATTQLGVKDMRYGTENPGMYVIKQTYNDKWDFTNETNGKTYRNGNRGSYYLYLFNLNAPGSSVNYINKSVKIYYYKVSLNGGLVFNGIPARRNSDNVLGMYNIVTGDFLTNVGTGTFEAGPDV